MKTAEEVIRWSIERFGPQLALSTSLQKGGIVVLDMALRIHPGIRVFTLDTGRLPKKRTLPSKPSAGATESKSRLRTPMPKK